MLRVGVIGYGYWGPNVLRNFMESPHCTVVGLSDVNESRLELARRRYPTVATTTDSASLIVRDDIDAIAIATPVSSHHQLALMTLKAGKHVWVEKPMAASVVEAEEMVTSASANGLVLHVDHTFVYTGAVMRIRQLIENGDLGDLLYYDSSRVNLGLFQRDVSVVWDLAVHDLSILAYLQDEAPVRVSATGISHVPGAQPDVAYLTVFYDSTFIAHVSVSWLAPVKIRQTLLGGSKKMVVYDDIEPSEKVRVYDKGITVDESNAEDVYRTLVSYRTGDMWAPKLDATEALGAEVAHFARCIEGVERQRTGGAAGLAVVRILEAATTSMAAGGAPVTL